MADLGSYLEQMLRAVDEGRRALDDYGRQREEKIVEVTSRAQVAQGQAEQAAKNAEERSAKALADEQATLARIADLNRKEADAETRVKGVEVKIAAAERKLAAVQAAHSDVVKKMSVAASA